LATVALDGIVKTVCLGSDLVHVSESTGAQLAKILKVGVEGYMSDSTELLRLLLALARHPLSSIALACVLRMTRRGGWTFAFIQHIIH